jgi:hypothetical protein
LDFDWRIVLVPPKPVVTVWELARRPSVRSFFLTMWLNVVPVKLWRKVELHQPIRFVRLAAYVVLVWVTWFIAGFIGSWITLEFTTWRRTPFFDTLNEMLGSPPAFSGGRLGIFQDALKRFGMLWSNESFQSYSWFTDPVMPHALFVVMGLWVALIPLGSNTFSQTLARCKVRHAHFVRVACYSAVTLPLMMLWVWIARFLPALAGRPGVLLALFGGLQFAFWWLACVRYLRLPHAAGVALAMVAIGGLLSVLFGVTGFGYGFMSWFI